MSSDIKELHKIWLKFLNTTKTKEGDVWLDLFLNKYLDLLSKNDGKTSNLFSFQWKSSSNILAHQLLSDMYQLCEAVKNNVSSEVQGSEVSDPFQKYLLEGRGWKILWTLESIGIKNLLCLKDLVKLLISHVPVLLSLSVFPSNIPDFLRKYPKHLQLESCFSPSRHNAVFANIKKMEILLPRKEIFQGKKRVRKKKIKPQPHQLDSSSGEDSMVFEPCVIPAIQMKTLKKGRFIHSDSMKISVSEIDESDLEFHLPDVSSSCEAKAPNNYIISVIDYLNFILNLFQESILLQKVGHESCSSSILEFSLNTLKLLHSDYFALKNWTQEDKILLSQQLLKLIFLSASTPSDGSMYVGAPTENEIMSTLFMICITKLSLAHIPCIKHEDTDFICVVLKGSLLLICNTVQTFSDDYAKIICMIRTFSEHSTEICCNLISTLDAGDKECSEIMHILDLIKDTIFLLKTLRISAVQPSDYDVSSRTQRIHHHHNLLGPPVSHSIINKEPMCCVASMSCLMLKVLNSANSKQTTNAILRHLKSCGICCCINPSFIIKTLFHKYSSLYLEAQQMILNLLGSFFYFQLGLSCDASSQCDFCIQRLNESYVLLPFTQQLALHSPVNLNSTSESCNTFWNSLSIYNELLKITNMETLESVAKHLCQLFSNGCVELKTQVFMRVILPQFLCLQIEPESGLIPITQIKIKCFLNILVNVFSSKLLLITFVAFDGIPILFKLLSKHQFRLQALSVIKALILSENTAVQDSSFCVSEFEGMGKDFSNLSSCIINAPAVNTFCSFLSEHTVLFLKILKDLFVLKDKAIKHNLDAGLQKDTNSNTVSESDNMLCELINDMPSTLDFVKEMWNSYKELFLNLKKDFFRIVSDNVLHSGYELLKFILENLNDVFEIQMMKNNLAIVDSVLWLFHSLLTIFICPNKEVSEQRAVLEMVKCNLMKHSSQLMTHQTFLFDIILKCCFENVAHNASFTDLYQEQKTKNEEYCEIVSSDNERTDANVSSESYLGDTENSTSFSGYDFAKSVPSHQIIIEHGEVIKMLFEFIVYLQADCKHDWTAASLHVIDVLIKLCQDNESNKLLLQSQGVPAMLLKGFSNSLNKTGENIKDFQIASMNLFITLTEAAMSPFELKQIIEFFKSANAPLDVLLTTLEKMVNGIKQHPLWSISFPCEQKINLNFFRIKKRFKVINNARHLYSSVKNATSAWRSSALFFPVSEDTKWNNFSKGFDFCFWLKLNSAKSSVMNKENELELSFNESQVFHLVSFGSDKFLLEFWNESYNSQFILRLKSYINGETTCLAKAVYKHQLLSDTWHHLCIKYDEKYEKSFFLSEVKLIIDGLAEKSFNFKYKRPGIKTVNPFHILLGHSQLQLNEEYSSSYLIGSFMLFKGDVLCRDILFYLSSLGPDVTTITECAVGKCNVFLPGSDSYSTANADIALDVQMGLKVPSLEKLQHSLLCSYTAENVDFYLVYPTITRRFLPRISVSKTSSLNLPGPQGWPYQKEPITVSIFSSANVQNIKYRGFLYAVQRIGGISVILFLFAYVLEHSTEPKNICDALNILLLIINSAAICFEDFVQIKGFELLSQMIMNCRSGLFNDLLPVFLDNCIAQNFMNKGKGRNGSITKVENNVVVTNPYIFFLMLKSISYSRNAPESVLTELFSVLDLLLNPKHSNLTINVKKMNTMKVIDTLLWLQKQNYILLENCSLPHVVNKMIPIIIEKLLSYKFDPTALQNISHFLLLMRNANYAYVCHSRPAFFYLYPLEYLKNSTEESAMSLLASYADEIGENYSLNDSGISHDTPVLQKSMSFPGESPKLSPLNVSRVKSLEFLNKEKLLVRETFEDAKLHHLNSEQSVTVKNETSWNKFSAEKVQSQSYDTEGKSSEICVGFLKLIYTFVENSSHSSIENILSNLQPEIFIILANSTDAKVCAASLNVIKIYLDAGGEKAKDEFLSIKGFHLLSNQLYCCPFSIEVINSCFSIMCGCTLDAVNINKIDSSKEISSYQMLSWLPVLALLPKCYPDPDTCCNILQILSHFIQLSAVAMIELLDNGLCMSLIHLLLKICHYHEQNYSSELELLESLPSIKNIGYIFKTLANQLYSCSSSKEFSTFCDILNLFMVCERKCTENCGPSSCCVKSLRSVLCSMLSASIEFTELYSSLSKTTNSVDFNVSSEEFSDLNAVTRKTDPRISAQTDVEKAVAEVPMSEIIGRVQVLVEIATDFVIFKDPRINIQTYEQEFIKEFFQFIIKGLSIATDINVIKSKYSTIMFAVKDSLKKQLSRLLMANLALHQNADMQEFMLEVLACHPSSRKLLHLIIFSITKVGNFLIFLHDIQRNAKSFRLKKYCLILNRNIESLLSGTPHLDTVKNEQLMKKLSAQWKLLWKEDRKKWVEKSNSLQERYSEKMINLAEEVSTVALHVTQKIFDVQNNVRKEFMEEYKSKYCDETSDRMNWIKLCNHFTHEKAVWYEEDCYPYSWELDPTEGPLRERRRLRRCDLNVESRFLRPEFAEKLENFKKDIPFVNVLNHHYEIPDCGAVPHRLFSHEQIKFTCLCKIVSAFEETSVEILIGECSIHVIGESTSYHRGKCPISESWSFNSIKEIVPRRYELQNNAFEIFLANGMTYLIAFLTEKDFQFIWKQLEENGLPCQSSKDVSLITQLWRESTVTNFEYLTQLNKFAGRSFNDLMQYPVFPFILADYSSSYLNLYDPTSFRNLSKPVAVQHKYRERFYMDTYNILKEQSCGPENEPELPISGPYHYGSHYSNSGTVLYFLIRLLPYTYNFIAYQDNNFDIPDRSFHSIYRSWHLVTEDSTSDVKELVPEFFFLPEFLCNKNGFDFGVTQAGIRVNDVLLPPWCKQNARLFILIHRQALESEMVTNKLHNWIDLIFGYKQTGDAAVEAFNVFHPATYYGLDISKWKDPITRKALQVMIKTLGQMPQQLFVNPHPMVSLRLSGLESMDQSSNSVEVIDTVKGLRWGDYVGSPSTGTPNLVWCRKQSTPLGSFLPLLTNYVFGLGMNTCLLLNHRKGASISSATYIMSAALISWGHDDGIVRIKLCRDQPVLPLLKANKIDPICLCASVPDRCELFVAHSSGIIYVYSLDLNPTEYIVHQKQSVLQLNGHSDAITAIYICKAFSIFVTASEDKTVNLWDLNQLSYIRSIVDHSGPVNHICVSDTLGDVVSISYFNSQSCMKVHTINGDIVGSVDITETITSVCYSSAPEGISVNVIATGFHSGIICLWSSWDLKPVREITCEKFYLPIKCLAFSADNQHLYASNSEGVVCVWEKPSKGLTNVPKLLIFA